MKQPTLHEALMSAEQSLTEALYGHEAQGQSRWLLVFLAFMWDVGYFCGAILFAPWVRFAKGFWRGIQE